MRTCPDCGQRWSRFEMECPNDGSILVDESPEQSLVGRVIGNYRIRRMLGRGGMGSVFEAEHPSIGSRVAVKLLHRRYASDPAIIERFFNEARAVNLIGHDNIVDVLDFARLDDGRPYLVMEYLDGVPLSTLTRTPQELAITGPIFLQVAEALQAAHEKGIVHRDLKPDNIYLLKRNRRQHVVKLMDFGIAKLRGELSGKEQTRTGIVMGTAHYMSPEQAAGEVHRIGPQSDIYSLGVLMFRLATGRLPFEGDNFGEILIGHISRPAPSIRRFQPDIDQAYATLVARCLEKQPNKRFASMDALWLELDALLERQGLPREAPLIRGEEGARRSSCSPLFLPEESSLLRLGSADRSDRSDSSDSSDSSDRSDRSDNHESTDDAHKLVSVAAHRRKLQGRLEEAAPGPALRVSRRTRGVRGAPGSDQSRGSGRARESEGSGGSKDSRGALGSEGSLSSQDSQPSHVPHVPQRSEFAALFGKPTLLNIHSPEFGFNSDLDLMLEAAFSGEAEDSGPIVPPELMGEEDGDSWEIPDAVAEPRGRQLKSKEALKSSNAHPRSDLGSDLSSDLSSGLDSNVDLLPGAHSGAHSEEHHSFNLGSEDNGNGMLSAKKGQDGAQGQAWHTSFHELSTCKAGGEAFERDALVEIPKAERRSLGDADLLSASEPRSGAKNAKSTGTRVQKEEIQQYSDAEDGPNPSSHSPSTLLLEAKTRPPKRSAHGEKSTGRGKDGVQSRFSTKSSLVSSSAKDGPLAANPLPPKFEEDRPKRRAQSRPARRKEKASASGRAFLIFVSLALLLPLGLVYLKFMPTEVQSSSALLSFGKAKTSPHALSKTWASQDAEKKRETERGKGRDVQSDATVSVHVSSTPTAARVQIWQGSSQQELKTPATLLLSPKLAALLQFDKPGFESSSRTLMPREGQVLHVDLVQTGIGKRLETKKPTSIGGRAKIPSSNQNPPATRVRAPISEKARTSNPPRALNRSRSSNPNPNPNPIPNLNSSPSQAQNSAPPPSADREPKAPALLEVPALNSPLESVQPRPSAVGDGLAEVDF